MLLSSMWPLLRKDGQGLQYFVVTFLWNYLIGYNPLRIPSSLHKLLSIVSPISIPPLHTPCQQHPPFSALGCVHLHRDPAPRRVPHLSSDTISRPLPRSQRRPLRRGVWNYLAGGYEKTDRGRVGDIWFWWSAEGERGGPLLI